MSDRFVIGPYGEKGTVPEESVDKVIAAGGRVLTKKEETARQLDEAYDKQSIPEKVLSTVATVAPVTAAARAAYKVATGHPEEAAPVPPPAFGAYVQGLSSGVAGGLPSVAMQQLLKAAGGDAAAKAYGKTAEEMKETHEGLYSAGQLAGFLGGAAAGPIGRAGAAAEGVTGNVLGGLATRGPLGRAAAAAGSLGVRGGVEGALYGAAQQVSDDMLGDHELAADKVFAASGLSALGGTLGGAALGGAGSLVGTALGGAGRGLARMVPKAAEAAEGIGETEGRNVVRDIAHDRAWRATGGLKRYAKEADKYLPNGTGDVGEALLRHGVINAEDGAISAGLHGTPASLAERIEAPLASVGQRLGQIAETSGARVPAQKILAAVDDVLDPLKKKAGFESIVHDVEGYRDSLMQKLGLKVPVGLEGYPPEIQQKVSRELLAKQDVSVQDLLFQRKAADELLFREGRAQTLSLEEKRAVRSNLEELITQSLDEASGKVPGELAAEYKALKHDYQALRIGQKGAQDAASGASSNRTFSLTDKIIGTAVGTTSHALGLPGVITGPAAAGISKVVRERGDAAAAVLLSRLADMQVVTKAMARIDELTGKAARGLLQSPKPSAAVAAATTPVRERAKPILERIAHAQANPEAVVDRVSRVTGGVSKTAPQFSDALSRRFTDGMAFLASRAPMPTAPPNPFAQERTPRLSPADASKLVRYDTYLQRPALILEEAANGRLTREGVDVLRSHMPGLFAELQKRTMETLVDMKCKNVKIAYPQQARLGMLLDIPTVAALRPDHMRLLQANVLNSGADAKASGPGAQPPKRPLKTSTQPSQLDRIEAKSA